MIPFIEKGIEKGKPEREGGFPQAGRRLWWISRLLAGMVGLILLTAALIKAADMDLFVRQIRGYGIVSHYLLTGMSAWGLIFVECSLGVALLLSYRPRLTLSLSVVLFLLFVGVSGWAWFSGATEECGCFGALLKRTPKQAVMEGLILIAALVLALLGHQSGSSPQRRSKFWAVAIAGLMGLAGPVFFAPDLSWINRPPSTINPADLGHLQIQGHDHNDLMSGSYLIVLMDTDCLHCQEAVPELNSLARADDLPTVIGLCVNDEEERRSFVEEFQPGFSLEGIGEEEFWRLVGHGDLPRIILLRDGLIQKVWDKKTPNGETIRSAQAGS